jgi:3-oxoacyl-(acyl-carrier-protein) synthase
MPRDAELFLASTVGEIEYIDNPERRCTCDMLLERALKVCEKDRGRIVSAACASSNSAFVSLNRHIRSGRLDSAVVIGTDYVSEFIFSGFATLRALARTIARPYDRNRDGLLLGDAASIINICSAKKAAELGLKPRAVLASGGMSCDAVHITAPMPHGEALSEAIVHALNEAGLTPDDIGAVIGHGTGTRYNDDMELQAIHRVFGERSVPMLSVKGACGHTLAGAGLVEAVVGVRMLETGLIPPQTSLVTPEPEAARYVSTEIRKLEKPRVLCMNSGFGGLNAVIILEAVS